MHQNTKVNSIGLKPRSSRKAGKKSILAAAIAIALLTAACGREREGPAERIETVSGIRTETVRAQNVPDEIEAPGTVIAVTTAQVAARTMGTVLQVAVREGDRVSRGQLLAQLDSRELAAEESSARAAEEASNAGVARAGKAVASAQAQADVLKKTYDRYVYLKEQKSVSPQEFDEVAAKYQAGEAGLAEAQAALEQAQAARTRAKSELQAAESVTSYARIVAPFDGRVLERRVEPGSLVSPGIPLFVLEDTSRYQLEVTLPADALGVVRKGSAARVQLDAVPGTVIEGRVAEMEAGADPASHTVKARVDLSNSSAVESGLYGRAFFATGEHKAMLVAGDALVTRGQLRGIYVVDANGLAHWRVLTIGKSLGAQVEVLSGLGEGETVVTNPGTLELDGKKISAAASQQGEGRP
ncbi:MAG TPA: efflux RND transporter periplasmic adaptor subunit [Terriglobia bacterium]|nr:efflux RND transporter periplasmic adaptor subunit [Terriglobia bacterium]